jgi:hypothetical protein
MVLSGVSPALTNLGQLASLSWMNKEALRERLESGHSPEHALLDQGDMKNRIIASSASFVVRAEWIYRFQAAMEGRPYSPLPMSRDGAADPALPGLDWRGALAVLLGDSAGFCSAPPVGPLAT